MGKQHLDVALGAARIRIALREAVLDADAREAVALGERIELVQRAPQRARRLPVDAVVVEQGATQQAQAAHGDERGVRRDREIAFAVGLEALLVVVAHLLPQGDDVVPHRRSRRPRAAAACRHSAWTIRPARSAPARAASRGSSGARAAAMCAAPRLVSWPVEDLLGQLDVGESELLDPALAARRCR